MINTSSRTARRCTMTAGDGAVDLAVPSSTGYRIDAHSSSFAPQIDLPNSDGASASLTVAASIGGIHIH
ncbi:hypothetical protein [Streptomyces shenzhenensis]|uniref:hypothetical protein n=1 Tax=Streptomyces shenzhenensis TaxID=943815 RepID=UPI001F3C9F88|nr:hypothetical protein [Streptomyces shenzhenensis]